MHILEHASPSDVGLVPISASLIGTRPTSDREGVLQDVHWSLGMFGYFPTYTLGSLYAAQLAETYAREHPLEDEIRRGEFGGLLAWLRTNIHRVGQRSSAEEIIANATGKGLDTRGLLPPPRSERLVLTMQF